MGKRFAIKKGLIIMKLCYFTYNFGAALIFPFIPLQMTDLGLTIEDIGYIYGLYPLITMFSGPISGFIGDKLGYRVILIIYILMSGAAATAFHFVPRCGEHKLQPHALLYNAGGTDEQYSQLLSVNWALCDMYDGSATTTSNASMSSSSCTESLAAIDLQDLPRCVSVRDRLSQKCIVVRHSRKICLGINGLLYYLYFTPASEPEPSSNAPCKHPDT